MPAPATAGDPRFFARSGPHTLAAVAAAAGGAAPEADLLLSGVAPLQAAGPDQVSFLDNRRYVDALRESRAGAVIVHPTMVGHVPAGCVAIVTKEPYLAWARAARLFHPLPPLRPGVHPAACVHPSAVVDPTAEVGPLAVIEAGAEIGPRCRIAPCAVIGEGVVLGPDCRVGAHASLSHALLGARVYIYPGARIGQEGFGFAVAPDGFETVPQLGRVLVEDDVEIGANSCVDRGSAQDTVIGAGSRLDNLVQIGHNVRLGRCCVIVSQAGISGSTVLEDFVQAGGQVGIAGHLRIGARARVGAQAGVMADVPAGAEVIGSPAQPVRDMFRQVAVLKKLATQYKAGGSAKGTDSD
ncbi:UDP-3-O-(3-hydroxymyristoyl)glucosamine N-acyltransferase [Limobrevibacterium gyesilva]|uniref:UDP-3-O-acylglucosamine N-acyltransferase n=1 Tax=Limobrevibacterium gyesilva TaxID=2991712 RepID=A0AA42CHR0_9PROT|nr:UDP-3-O-(3-hydroxymyristoyl)glucosamine N-acyltransferase [Limobrevibacterium gyesilva]MCW3475232.1 UDP-3-O-(3-hydroxymyristoyl)glucosamine N-acyltransferase [Limobrevibacterium gyesilva]